MIQYILEHFNSLTENIDNYLIIGKSENNCIHKELYTNKTKYIFSK